MTRREYYLKNRESILEKLRNIEPERRARKEMLKRCYNPNAPQFPRYGGRGITVCQRWRESYSWFLMDLGPKPSSEHSLDRIDNNGNYEPGNCRWATDAEQRRNKRTTVLFTINGETLCQADWATRFGIPKQTFYNRIKRGVVPELAVIP